MGSAPLKLFVNPSNEKRLKDAATDNKLFYVDKYLNEGFNPNWQDNFDEVRYILVIFK